MLRFDTTKLRAYPVLQWGERDIPSMLRILGAEQAIKLRAPYSPSLVYAAHRRGMRLHTTVRERLERELRLRERAAEERQDDADGPQDYFPHQRADLQFMTELGMRAYLLAHQPGVGKTLEAMMWAVQQGATRILVITPNSAKLQWRREIKRWLGRDERVRIVQGTVAEQSRIVQRQRGWIIGHWESLVHAEDAYLKYPWDVVILDEAHNIKNRDAIRSQVAHHLDAEYRIALTAHPFTNSPDELWSILHFLYPMQYSSFWRFFGQHIKAIPKPFGGYEILGARNPKLLKWEMAPFTLRRLKKDVFKSLPPVVRSYRWAYLTKHGVKEYDKLRRDFFVELKGHGDAQKILAIPSVLARITRLRQYLIDPSLLGGFEPSVKYPIVAELLGDLDGPPVIFTSFKEAAINLANYLRTQKITRVRHINGAITAATREVNKRAFLAGKLDALIVVKDAGKEALNLGKYGYVIYLDIPWTPKDLEQMEGRVDRPEEGTGKLVPTTSYSIIVQHSYEEKMMAKVNKKHGMFREVFTVGDLRELFST